MPIETKGMRSEIITMITQKVDWYEIINYRDGLRMEAQLKFVNGKY